MKRKWFIYCESTGLVFCCVGKLLSFFHVSSTIEFNDWKNSPHVPTWGLSEANVLYWRKSLWHCWDFSAPSAVIPLSTKCPRNYAPLPLPHYASVDEGRTTHRNDFNFCWISKAIVEPKSAQQKVDFWGGTTYEAYTFTLWQATKQVTHAWCPQN